MLLLDSLFLTNLWKLHPGKNHPNRDVELLFFNIFINMLIVCAEVMTDQSNSKELKKNFGIYAWTI